MTYRVDTYEDRATRRVRSETFATLAQASRDFMREARAYHLVRNAMVLLVKPRDEQSGTVLAYKSTDSADVVLSPGYWECKR
jgi:hypothetical protein